MQLFSLIGTEHQKLPFSDPRPEQVPDGGKVRAVKDEASKEMRSRSAWSTCCSVEVWIWMDFCSHLLSLSNDASDDHKIGWSFSTRRTKANLSHYFIFKLKTLKMLWMDWKARNTFMSPTSTRAAFFLCGLMDLVWRRPSYFDADKQQHLQNWSFFFFLLSSVCFCF